MKVPTDNSIMKNCQLVRGLKARRPAFTSHRPRTFIGNCAVVVTKCSLPTRYRDHLYNTKYFRPVHQHNCVNRHFSKFKGRDSNEAKTWLKESMTAKLILTSASSGKRNVRSGLKPGMSLAKVPSCSECVCSSPRSVSSLPSYSSPLLSPGSTTTPLSTLSPPHTPHNRDRAAAGLNDLSTTAASSDTHAPLTSSPALTVIVCDDDWDHHVVKADRESGSASCSHHHNEEYLAVLNYDIIKYLNGVEKHGRLAWLQC